MKLRLLAFLSLLDMLLRMMGSSHVEAGDWASMLSCTAVVEASLVLGYVAQAFV